MDSLLDALQEGRLIELPDNDKLHSLQFLSHIIEAIPSVPTDTDVEGLVLVREKNTITALGKGFACPHARAPYDEDLICSVGWSPAGIDYGASDGAKVHIIIMYLVPNNQRNQYLKEISLLAKALQNDKNVESLGQINDLDDIRNFLLDLVVTSKETAGSEARAKMIKLETMDNDEFQKIEDLSKILIEAVTIVSGKDNRHIILSQNNEILDILENKSQLFNVISEKGFIDINNWRIVKKSQTHYLNNSFSLDCIAVKLKTNIN